MAHVLCHPTEARVQFQVSLCEICVDKVAKGEVYLQVLQFSHAPYYAANTSYLHFIHLVLMLYVNLAINSVVK
jgi:hypothetical protein